MKIVIDIPNWLYNAMLEHREPIYSQSLGDAVRDGIPLPKGHGRLIDADELRCENADFDTYNDYCTMFDEIDNAPTIIEADEIESEG